MKENCECNYCKNKVNEYFCSECKHKFNECESYFEYRDPRLGCAPVSASQLCPKCHPETWDHNSSNHKFNIFRKVLNEMKTNHVPDVRNMVS